MILIQITVSVKRSLQIQDFTTASPDHYNLEPIYSVFLPLSDTF